MVYGICCIWYMVYVWYMYDVVYGLCMMLQFQSIQSARQEVAIDF